LTEILRRRGIKVTPQRLCVFRLLHGNDTHPTAEAVYAAARAELPTLSLRTVYAILDELADLGEIQILSFGSGASRFDPHVGSHHHLVCESCGLVRDLDVEFPGVEVPVEAAQGFEIDDAHIVFRGRCVDCMPGPVPGHRVQS